MNIQIFGRSKGFDTQKARRWFKERRVPYQDIDMGSKGMSRGELLSVVRAVGLDALIDPKAEDAAILKYLASEDAKIEKLLENQKWILLPIVRNGRKATVGFKPEVWKDWE